MAEGVRGRDEPAPKVRRSSETAERKSGDEVCGTNIDHLPDELMVNIFSYFSVNELMDILQNVCERWKRLVHVPAIWLDKRFVVGSTQYEFRDCCRVQRPECLHCRFAVEDEEILRTAPMMPQLRKLIIRRNIEDRVLREICTNWPNLTDLRMHSYQEMNYSLMEHVFQKCPKIERLTTGANLLNFQRSVELLSSLEHLKSVELAANKENPGPVRLRVLADGCPRLEMITIYCKHYELEVNDMEYFLRTMKHSLTSATLPWMMEGRMSVVPLLKQCDTSLKRLNLFAFDALPEQQATTFEALGELHSLQVLAISITPCQPGVISLAFRPGCLTQLRQLLLAITSNIQDETVINISWGCTNLVDLRILGAANITDLALSEIHRLKHLKLLFLSGCDRLGGAAMAHLAQLPALHTLVLRNFRDLTRLQPSLQQIVDMKELRCLDLLESCYNTAVPFDDFPGRLVKLRVLRVTYDGENKSPFARPEHNMPETFFSELQRKMPHLRVFNTPGSWR